MKDLPTLVALIGGMGSIGNGFFGVSKLPMTDPNAVPMVKGFPNWGRKKRLRYHEISRIGVPHNVATEIIKDYRGVIPDEIIKIIDEQKAVEKEILKDL